MTEQTKAITVKLVAWLVGLNGLVIIATTLLDQIALTHHRPHLSAVLFDIPILIGLTLLYLSSLLMRQKQNAWFVTLLAYVFYIGIGVSNILNSDLRDEQSVIHILQTIVLPIIIIGLLLRTRPYFTVGSDRRGFIGAIRFSLIILLVAFLYGVSGYVLMDMHDYHREISVPTAAHLTLDQLDLATSSIQPYTTRARLFDSSLSFIGVAAIAYVFIAFFQPIRDRVRHQQTDYVVFERLLHRYGGLSEDYFKLWPRDKQYYFDDSGRSSVAYAVHAGVAIVLGNPVGDSSTFNELCRSFKRMCFKNDWRLAFLHVDSTYISLFDSLGLTTQKIGSEAVVDTTLFTSQTVRNKYFRHINNKFTKLGYTTEILAPPHNSQTISDLERVSSDWLGRDGREERSFVMGYFTPEYMQKCTIIVLKDEHGVVLAFANIVPAAYDTKELTYDLLRNTSKSPSNSIDILLIKLIEYAHEKQYQHINLGLCPLYGMKDQADKQGLLDTLLHFMFTYGNRVYAFSGLHRFKSKYEPEWRDRYLAYEDGITGLTKTVNALIRTMKV